MNENSLARPSGFENLTSILSCEEKYNILSTLLSENIGNSEIKKIGENARDIAKAPQDIIAKKKSSITFAPITSTTSPTNSNSNDLKSKLTYYNLSKKR